MEGPMILSVIKTQMLKVSIDSSSETDVEDKVSLTDSIDKFIA